MNATPLARCAALALVAALSLAACGDRKTSDTSTSSTTSSTTGSGVSSTPSTSPSTSADSGSTSGSSSTGSMASGSTGTGTSTDTTTGSGTSMGAAGTGTAGAAGGSLEEQCVECQDNVAFNVCKDQYFACTNSDGCAALLQCYQTCNDDACYGKCWDTNPKGQEGYYNLYYCYSCTACGDTCGPLMGNLCDAPPPPSNNPLARPPRPDPQGPNRDSQDTP